MSAMDATTNVEQLELTLSSLRSSKRLQKVNSAHVQMVRSMAHALDMDSSNAALWRQYREALKELLNHDDDGGSLEHDINALLSNVGDSSTARA